MEIALAVFVSVYVLMLILILITWIKIPLSEKSDCTDSLKMSVIIPVRNEARNILRLLDDLGKQNYTNQYFEVIAIDDHSDDSTFDKVSSASQTVSYKLKIISLDVTTGKKEAIKKGIESSLGEIIVTTDADCRVGVDWLCEIARQFKRERTNLVFGPVKYTYAMNSFSSWQAMEFAVLQTTGAATLHLGVPTMCNGANMAYRKKVFFEVGGFRDNEYIASGDDEFLMHKVFQIDTDAVKFIKSRYAIVETTPLPDLKSFINQRRRWASKWEGYRIAYPKILAIAVFVANLSIMAGAILAITGYIHFFWFLAIWIMKFIPEYLLLVVSSKFFEIRIAQNNFLILAVLYPVYAVFFGIAGRFGKYRWKERDLK